MEGIVTVLNTPFTADNEIDTPGLQRTIINALDAGVSGFLVGGLAAEVNHLTPDERLHILEVTRDVVQKRVPILAGAFGESRADRLDMVRAIVSAGCDGVMASVPYTTPDEFSGDIHALAECGPGFLMVQDWDPGGTGIPVPLIVELFETIPAFTWLKIEVILAGPKYTEVLNKTSGRLKVAGGWAVNEMIDALDRGVHAFMPTGMHRIYTEIYRLHRAGRRADAERLFDDLKSVLAVSNQNLEISIHFFKRLLYQQGIFATDRCRCPKPGLSATQQEEFEAMIAWAISIETRLANQSS